jgi:1-deoxy-D-xylulose-5-phosphate reductoisomerase
VARWLFDVPPEMIRVVIHPQSIIHSLVEFHDGSVISQMGNPDMKVPIQYALTYPRREPLPVQRLELDRIGVLTFHPPDPVRFPALRLAHEVLRAGGTAPAVLNAANEAAVASFLREEIGFTDILWSVEETLHRHEVISNPTLEEIFRADSWAREETLRQIHLRQPQLE